MRRLAFSQAVFLATMNGFKTAAQGEPLTRGGFAKIKASTQGGASDSGIGELCQCLNCRIGKGGCQTYKPSKKGKCK